MGMSDCPVCMYCGSCHSHRMDARPHTIAAQLLAWYDQNARTLPWRAPPGAPRRDPYHVWLSEVMLQQTTVAAVGPYFAAFLERWPCVEDLAAADDADVMAAWAGLGYYARARNLLACARKVANQGGQFPASEEDLRALPGLGAYTAAAIAAIAFGQRAVVVDANVERVVSRLFAIEAPLPSSRPRIRIETDSITPEERSGDFAQAMMDLGSQVCTVRAPRCLLCPLREDCIAAGQNTPEAFPKKAPKAAKKNRVGHAYWIECEDRVWVVQREGKGMLGGMRALPDDGWVAAKDGDGNPPFLGDWIMAGRVSHVFSHFSLDLQVMKISLPKGSSLLPEGGEWWPIAQIREAGLPTLFAKAAQRVVAGREADDTIAKRRS